MSGDHVHSDEPRRQPGHQHGHHHLPQDAGDVRVGLAILVNVLLTVVQIIGGLLSGSVALIADAVHNLSDAASLLIAFFARRIARQPTDAGMTFGYKRVELVAALINLTTLVVIGVYLLYEGVLRFFAPPEVAGWLVIVVALGALVVDAVTAFLTWRLSKESANIRAAFLHNLADALGSVAVIVVGVLIVAFDWRLADPIATVGIAGYIIWMGVSELRSVARILMLGAPPEIETEAVIATMTAVSGVEGVHHVHLWQISEDVVSVEAHVVVGARDWPEAMQVKSAIKTAVQDQFGIGHVTLDLETHDGQCVAPERIGGRR